MAPCGHWVVLSAAKLDWSKQAFRELSVDTKCAAYFEIFFVLRSWEDSIFKCVGFSGDFGGNLKRFKREHKEIWGSKEPMLGRFDVIVSTCPIPIFDFHPRLLAIHCFRWLIMSHIDSREVSRSVCSAFFSFSMNERDD